MAIDIKTLIIILGFTHLMQVLVFYHQFRVNKAYRGIAWWLMWSAVEVIGFSAMLFRSIPSFLPYAIIIQNTMIVAGTVFLYIGIKQFFNKSINLKLLIPILTVFEFGLLYFLFINDNIQIRSGLISIVLAIMAFLTAYSLFTDKTRSSAAGANFNALIFLVHGGIFIYRLVMIIGGTPVDNIFSSDLFNLIIYFDALIVSLLWTFGLAIMLNQRLNNEMMKAKEDLELVFNTSPDAALITRMEDGLIMDVNEGYSLVSGYTRDEMIGKATTEINIWKNIYDREKVVSILKKQGYCTNFEAEFIIKDGSEITGLMSSKVINLHGIPHIISITRDITGRKRTEAELEKLLDASERSRKGMLSILEDQMLDITARIQAEQSLRTYTERLKNLHRIDQAILQAIDSPGKITKEAISQTLDLLKCQRVSVYMFDFEKKEARVFATTGSLKSSIQEGMHLPEDCLGDLNILRQKRLEVVEDSSKVAAIQSNNCTDLREGIQSYVNAPVLSPDGLIGVLSIGWDKPRSITPEELEIISEVADQISIATEHGRLLIEKRQHAEELEKMVTMRTAELEASNRELEAFSYSVSHDLRAPLRHIYGYVELLNERFHNELSEKARYYLDVITGASKQMDNLIDDLLQFSRTGRQELNQAVFDMNVVVNEEIEKIKPEAENRKISWSVQELPAVSGDASLLRLVWANLIDNAVKYTRNKKSTTIAIGFTEEKEKFVFFIRDNGVGFDMKYAHKLFGVFQRLHSPAEFEGTGIGLANVQRIVQKHNGMAWADAKPGKGATFFFSIPK
jgi:PAS domain S-box-containing protein